MNRPIFLTRLARWRHRARPFALPVVVGTAVFLALIAGTVIRGFL